MKKLNLIGHKYHRLTVLEEAEDIQGKSKGRVAWKCLCDCGNIKIIKAEHLRDGTTKSCGCLCDEKRSERARKMYSVRTLYTPQEASARKIWRTTYSEMVFEDFYDLCQKNCYYCGKEPSNYQNAAVGKFSSEKVKTDGYFTYNGLDRVDNSLEHTKENCVPCCKQCNYAKRDQTLEDFKLWISTVYNYFIKPA